MPTLEEKQLALGVIKRILTEENTDKVIKVIRRRIKRRLPRRLRWLPIGKVLDYVFPDLVVDYLEELLS